MSRYEAPSRWRQILFGAKAWPIPPFADKEAYVGYLRARLGLTAETAESCYHETLAEIEGTPPSPIDETAGLGLRPATLLPRRQGFRHPHLADVAIQSGVGHLCPVCGANQWSVPPFRDTKRTGTIFCRVCRTKFYRGA